MSLDECHVKPPLFLEEYEKEISKHKDLTSNNVKVLLKSDERLFADLRNAIDKDRLDVRLRELNSSVQKRKRELSILEAKTDSLQLTVDTLHNDRNSEQSKLTDRKDELVVLSQSCQQKREYLQVAQAETTEVRDSLRKKYEAAMSVKRLYKSWMGYRLKLLSSDEKGYIFNLSFDEFSKSDEKENPIMFAKLCYDVPWKENPEKYPSGKWWLLETNPPLAAFQHLAERLNTSQNICAVVCALREEFQNLQVSVYQCGHVLDNLLV